MTEALYRIEELLTSGWSTVEPTDVNLTKEQAQQRLKQLIEDGYNPNTLRATRES
jgi:hypothetical protein